MTDWSQGEGTSQTKRELLFLGMHYLPVKGRQSQSTGLLSAAAHFPTLLAGRGSPSEAASDPASHSDSKDSYNSTSEKRGES